MDIQVNPKSIASGLITATEALRDSRLIADSAACEHVFVRHFDASAQAAAEAIDGIRASGAPLPALAGVPVSIKDLFDVAGQPTTAGSKSMADARAAQSDCTAVARLRAAGAVLVGHTNLSEFAYSGVGINPHHGTPRNPVSPDGAVLVPGGSTSGGAVSVATGACWAALGSDTGGSIRIPAALNGVVGFKNTARLVPTQGALPLSTTLDTVCATTRSVRDAIVVHEVLAQRRVARSTAPLPALRLAVPTTVFLDGLDAPVAQAFERTLAQLRQAGAQIAEIDLPAMRQQPAYGFSAPESYAWHRELLQRAGERYDPRVRKRIEAGATLRAWEYIDLLRSRQQWIADMQACMTPYDALLSPTVPITAPLLASVAPAEGQDAAMDAARDAEFFRVNALLLRNTSAVNLLDGCALSLPCHTAGELPVGLMVWHAALHDDTVLHVGLQIEELLQKQ